jgi:predicted peptidase
VPICGFESAETALKLKGKPVWTLIGDADGDRLLGSTRAMVSALRDAGSDVRYTEYRSVGHNSWDRAYNTPELIAWMLEQKR